MDKAKDIAFKVELPDPMEQMASFHYGIVAVKKVDLRYLINSLPRNPSDSVQTINCGKYYLCSLCVQFVIEYCYLIETVKQLLYHDDDIGLVGGEENNKLTVSLRDPFSAARLVHPARSKHCKHVACFDLKSFIEMNEASSKWRCPHCRDYIVINDLIVDGQVS